MLGLVLAVASGMVWGVGDFAGGKAAQRADAVAVAWLSKLVSMPLLGLYLLLLAEPLPGAVVGWGAAAGVAGYLGLLLFYRALAAGAMTVVAPLAGVTSAVIPVLVGLAMGEWPGGRRLLGVGCAILAIALVSMTRPRPGEPVTTTRGLVGAAVAAGVGFALFFVFLAQAGRAAAGRAGLWPVLASQVAALVLGAVVLAVLGPVARARRAAADRAANDRQLRWPDRRGWAWVTLAGPCDMSANALYLAASRHGELSVVAPLSALYPVTTVLLAVLVDRERPRPAQVAGLILAAAALLLVAR